MTPNIRRLLKFFGQYPLSDYGPRQKKALQRARNAVILPTFLVVPLLLVVSTDQCDAQPVRAEALLGAPFGIARVTVPLSPDAEPLTIEAQGYLVKEENGRIMFPAINPGGIASRIRSQFDGGSSNLPRQLTLHIPFVGRERLELAVRGTEMHRVVVTPARRPRLHRLWLRRWWTSYLEMTNRQRKLGDYPPIVETYLSHMLSWRLNFAIPTAGLHKPPRHSTPRAALELIVGTESLRQTVMTDTLVGRPRESANEPVPEPPEWFVNAEVLPANGPVEDESFASHVPEECFLVRFGNFRNYLWLKHLSEQYGGELGRMLRLRGHTTGASQRMQRQLGLRESALAKILGDKVIADIGLIGQDLYLNEGAAIGVLFQARNALLGIDLKKQRAAALQREQDLAAAETTLTIGGNEVSLVSTPGNELRSFYAVDGAYHLVTTSRRMVERFYEAGKGVRSLAHAPGFAQARMELDQGQKDRVFVFMSSSFFRQLISPAYQIELRRRLRAATDIQLVKLARRAAQAEGLAATSPEELSQEGYLLPHFSHRPDESRLLDENGRIYDSIRGSLGTFLPVPDVQIHAVTPEEAARYDELVGFVQSNWQQADPLSLSLVRAPPDAENVETVDIRARMLPFHSEQYERITSLLGAPSAERITPAPGDIVTAQAIVRGGLMRPHIGEHHLFLGVQDLPPHEPLPTSKLRRTLRLLTRTPGYLGAWPQPGWLDALPLVGRRLPDIDGYTSLPLGLWRRQFEGFSVLSFAHPILRSVTPHLELEDTDVPAQVRIHVGDLQQAKIQPWINDLYFHRARLTTLGNLRLMHTLNQQLGVPRVDCRRVAENLLNVGLECSLAGDYELKTVDEGFKVWTSDALSPRRATPDQYRAPPLSWLRGLDASLVMLDDRLDLDATIRISGDQNEQEEGSTITDLFGE